MFSHPIQSANDVSINIPKWAELLCYFVISICGILKVLFDLVHYFTLSLKGHFEVYCTQVIL